MDQPHFLVEPNALSEALAECECVASWFGLAKDLTYDLRKRDTLNREFNITAVYVRKGGESQHGCDL